MSLYMEEEGGTALGLDAEKIAASVMDAALEYANCPYEAEVNLLLTEEDEIRDLNKTFREMDKPTDVLSFPLLEYRTPGDFSPFECQAEAFDPDSGELMLGDIVICKPKVLAQAEEYGHGVRREFAFLIAHSMLHLFGYDHMEESQREEMEQKQREIMDMLKISR